MSKTTGLDDLVLVTRCVLEETLLIDRGCPTRASWPCQGDYHIIRSLLAGISRSCWRMPARRCCSPERRSARIVTPIPSGAFHIDSLQPFGTSARQVAAVAW